MTRHDIHEGIGMAASVAYRAECQERYWDAMGMLDAATTALAAINNHIQLLNGGPADVVGTVEITS